MKEKRIFRKSSEHAMNLIYHKNRKHYRPQAAHIGARSTLSAWPNYTQSIGQAGLYAVGLLGGLAMYRTRLGTIFL